VRKAEADLLGARSLALTKPPVHDLIYFDAQQEPATEWNCSLVLSGSNRGCGRRHVGPAIAGRPARTRFWSSELPISNPLARFAAID
jgi:hypothetical protein